ncbi:MAG: DUF5063 domain-containing protein [Actinomycetales bacterium]
MLGQRQDAEQLRRLAESTAAEAKEYLDTVTALAAGDADDDALSVLMVALSRIIAAGAKLGAVADVRVREVYEPDSGPDADVEDLHMGLAGLLEGLDEYVEIVDPVVSGELSQESLSNDLAEIAAALGHGMTHFDHGRYDEALWFWQYSFMASWGDRAVSGLRTLVSMLGHIRLDVEVNLGAPEVALR